MGRPELGQEPDGDQQMGSGLIGIERSRVVEAQLGGHRPIIASADAGRKPFGREAAH